MNPLIKRLHEQRMNIEHEIRSIIDAAPAEGLSADDDGKIDELAKRSDELAAALTDRIEAEERANAIVEKIGERRTSDEPSADDKLEAEFRAFLNGETRSVTIRPERRDYTKGSSTAGGNTVPTSFYDQLLEHMIEVSAIMQAGATVLTTTSGENLQVPVTTAHPTGALVAEGAAIAESDATFGQRTLGAYKYGVLSQVSSELVNDTGVDLLGYLARACGRAVGNALGTDLVVGDGSSKPTGLMTSTTLGITGAGSAAGVFTVANLIDLYYSVIGPYRMSPQAAWLVRDATAGAMRKLQDGDNSYFWSPATGPGEVDRFMNKPVFTDPNVAAVAATARSVAFGDMSAYIVRMVNGIRFERSDEYAFNTDLVTFRCVVRADGILADQTGAVKHFVGGAA